MEVVLRNEPILATILDRGRVWRRPQLEIRPGKINCCHENAARLYRQDPHRLQIVAGWVLHPDDVVWRQHSWLLNGSVLVETTVAAVIYYGAVLDSHEAVRFARAELGA